MTHGAVEFVAVEFPGDIPGPELAEELGRLVDAGTIEIIDILFVRKGHDGTLTHFELGRDQLTDGYADLDRIVSSVDGLIGEEDVAAIGADLTPGTTAAFLVFEHAWLRSIRARLAGSGARVVYSERVPGPAVDEYLSAVTN